MSNFRIVLADEIRARFNQLDLSSLHREMVEYNHPSRPKARVPFCTKSWLCDFYLDGRFVASAHQYQLPNGDWRGLPDPKEFVDLETGEQFFEHRFATGGM